MPHPRHENERKRPRLALRMVAALAAAAVAGQVSARSLADIRKTKEIRICLYADSPAMSSAEPAGCRENCRFAGPVYEQAMAFAQSLGKDIKAKLVRVKWDEQFFDKSGRTEREASYTPELLAAGRCDLYPNNVTRNDWRLKKLDFVTLFPSRMMVIVHQSKKAAFKNSANLVGKTAALEKDTSYHSWVQAQNATVFADNPVKLELMRTHESLAAVDDGKVDFTIVDSDAALWATRHKLKNAAVAFPVGPADDIGWAFRKDDKDLQTAVQEFFDEQKKSEASAFNTIWQKHFGISLNNFVGLVKSAQ